jgi:hypothetical protein
MRGQGPDAGWPALSRARRPRESALSDARRTEHRPPDGRRARTQSASPVETRRLLPRPDAGGSGAKPPAAG